MDDCAALGTFPVWDAPGCAGGSARRRVTRTCDAWAHTVRREEGRGILTVGVEPFQPWRPGPAPRSSRSASTSTSRHSRLSTPDADLARHSPPLCQSPLAAGRRPRSRRLCDREQRATAGAVPRRARRPHRPSRRCRSTGRPGQRGPRPRQRFDLGPRRPNALAGKRAGGSAETGTPWPRSPPISASAGRPTWPTTRSPSSSGWRAPSSDGREELLAYFDTGGVSNGPTEAVNALAQSGTLGPKSCHRVGAGMQNAPTRIRWDSKVERSAAIARWLGARRSGRGARGCTGHVRGGSTSEAMPHLARGVVDPFGPAAIGVAIPAAHRWVVDPGGQGGG
jgi:hypothetical protein